MIILLRMLSHGLALLPLSWALVVGRGLGWVMGHVVRHHRADALDALARSMPELSPTEVRRAVNRMYAHLGMTIVECARLIRANRTYASTCMEWIHQERLDHALKEGGVLALSAHCGNWELAPVVAPVVLGCSVDAITKPIKGRALQRYMAETRGRFGLGNLPSKGAYREILRRLRQGHLIGFVLDQNMIDREGVFVDFFGRPACTTPGLAHLSAATGCPVVPIFAERLPDGRHRVHVLEAMEPPPDKEEATLTAYTQRYTRLIEDFVREHPEQWIWLHRRWKTTPK